MNSNIPRTTKTIAIWLAIGMMGIATRFVFAQAQNAPPPPQGNSQHHNVPAPATRPLSPLGPGENDCRSNSVAGTTLTRATMADPSR